MAFSQFLKFKECFNACNKTQGECNWCGGMGGWCCRKVEKMEWIGNGCDGTFGGDSFHACVLNPGLDPNVTREVVCYENFVVTIPV